MNSDIRRRLMDFLRERVSQRTEIPAAEIADDTELGSIGVRSIDAVLISGQVEDEFEIEVDPMLMFEYRTLDEVAQRLMEIIEGA